MIRLSVAPLALLVALIIGWSPVHAKKPGSDEAALPKGLQKKVARGGELPPGWQKKLQRGEVLEPEVVRYGEPVPERVRLKLPVAEQGSIDITLDGKVIRLEEATRRILNVFEVRL
jgi:hypothetical protein